MESFMMNGYLWKVERIHSDSPMLVDRTGTLTVGTTDPIWHKVYLSNRLEGDFLIRVLLHELGHCALISYGLIDDIHRMVYPEYWIEAEEAICNFIADYGFRIFASAFKILGYNAWKVIPNEFEKLLAA